MYVRVGLLVALVASCAPAEVAEVSVPRMVAACELAGVTLYENPYTRDSRVGEYIVTCMREKGYGISFTNTPCEADANLRDPRCYQPITD